MTQDEFSAEAIRRVPVAEGVLSSLAVLFSEERMASLYERHRGASYESELSFHSVVKLMYSAVIEHGAVGSAAFKAARSVYCTFQVVEGKDKWPFGPESNLRTTMINSGDVSEKSCVRR